jgi:hypothetical protein
MYYLHKPAANLSCFQKSTYCAGVKIFSNLPSYLKRLMNEKAQFKIALKWYLNTHSFYSVDEYLLSKKMTHPFKGCVSRSWQYWCIYVDVFLNRVMCNHCVFLCGHFNCTVHMFLYLYDVFRILQSFWLILDPGNAVQCNAIMHYSNEL